MRAFPILAVMLVSCMLLPPPACASEAMSDGFMIRVNMPVTSLSSLVNSAAGVPQFAVGLRRGRVAYGLGLGFSRAGVTTETSGGGFKNKTEMNGTLFQVAPTLWLDFWQSEDGRTSGNVAAAFQYGRINAKTESRFSNPFGSGSSEDKADGNLFGFVLGVGGDHHLTPNFAIGLEAGAQGIFGTDIKSEDAGAGGGGGGSGPEFGFSTSILYGAMRATLTF